MQDQTPLGEAPKSRRGFLKFALVGGIGVGIGTYLGIRQHPMFRNSEMSTPEPVIGPEKMIPISGNAPATAEPASTSRAKYVSTAAKWEEMTPAKRWATLTKEHPAGETLNALFPKKGAGLGSVSATGLSRADYLPLILANVDFFRQHQNKDGAIIDPYQKRECQYATPAFALSAATAIAYADRADLVDPAVRAFSFALTALENHSAADNHPDFYIPMLVHAYRVLKDKVPAATSEAWRKQFAGLVPQKSYRNTNGHGNWNIVHVCGEWLRRKDGLVAPDQRTAQEAYLEGCLGAQLTGSDVTPFGMYCDANAPLAYDAFPRLWLEDMLGNDAYQGPRQNDLLGFLTRGGLSTLLLQSPTGEWASGGRSAQHQWNEAEVAVICEANAARWKRWGRPDVAGAFKRGAHLALGSVKRWQRPSGELWIVKNHADPAQRFGYEGYSYHSQYNLLTVAILSLAYNLADDSIEEAPTPSERGSYVFDVRDVYHKVAAASGGSYVLIDTNADPDYDSTGLLRFQHAGVPYSLYSANTAARRAYGPRQFPTLAMTPGIQWRDDAGSAWRSLANFERHSKASGTNRVDKAELAQPTTTGGKTGFTLRYGLSGHGGRSVEETYTVSGDGVLVTSKLAGEESAPSGTRVVFPALVSDGASDTQLTLQGSKATVTHQGSRLTWEVVSPKGAQLKPEGERIPTRNGFVQALVADLPFGTREVTWRIVQEKTS